jgi:hypothetical protein
LSKSVYEIENSFTSAEISEWAEYLQNNPPYWHVAELQRAMQIQAQAGGKLGDYMITNNNSSQNDLRNLTVEEINEIAGVT